MTTRVPRAARLALACVAVALASVAARVAGQIGPLPLTILARDGRRTLPTVGPPGQDLVALNDLAAAFQLTVRDDAGALTVSSNGRTAVLTGGRPLASVNGRLIVLPSPPVRVNNRWAVPPEFLSRALALVLDTPIEWRRASRLVIVGPLRVPRVTVRSEGSQAAAQLTVETSPRAAATITREGSQLLLRFDADALDATIPPVRLEGIVQAVRQVDAITVAIDLGPRFGTYHATTASQGVSSRLDLSLTPLQQADAAPPPVPPAQTSAGASARGPGESTQAAPATRGAVTASAPWTVVVDAGHGGEDAGSRGATGTLEKDVTLAAARGLRAAIESRLGARVLMTRDDDRPVSLEARTSLANNNKADLLISLHANWSPRASASGAALYVAAFDDAEPPRPEPPTEAVPLPGGRVREIELVRWERAQRRYLDRSTDFATRLEARLQGSVPLGQHAVSRLPLPLLGAANMPAVLIEMGYLSHPEQEQQLSNGALPNLVVQAVVDVIATFMTTPVTAPNARDHRP